MDPETLTRPRSKSTFSLKSNKGPKMDLTETPMEKKKGRFSRTTKKDPNRALQEAQPGAFLAEPSTLTSLRGIQHRDPQGNLIKDPDATNPTRPRLERPLDTIRSFEAAIDNGYRRRSQMTRAESSPSLDTLTGLPGMPHMLGRRTASQYGGEQSYNPRSFSQPGYSRHQSLRGTHNYDGYGNPPPQNGSRRSLNPRMGPPPMQYNSNGDYNSYPIHQYQDPHDTNNGESSGTEWANSTDPSSENSSIDRVALKHIDPERVSPIHGAIMEENLHNGRPYPSEERYNGPMRRMPMHSSPNGMPNGTPPQAQQVAAPRPVIRLGGDAPLAPLSAPKGPIYPGAKPAIQRMDSEKKKSGWLKKRFSKG